MPNSVSQVVLTGLNQGWPRGESFTGERTSTRASRQSIILDRPVLTPTTRERPKPIIRRINLDHLHYHHQHHHTHARGRGDGIAVVVVAAMAGNGDGVTNRSLLHAAYCWLCSSLLHSRKKTYTTPSPPRHDGVVLHPTAVPRRVPALAEHGGTAYWLSLIHI